MSSTRSASWASCVTPACLRTTSSPRRRPRCWIGSSKQTAPTVLVPLVARRTNLPPYETPRPLLVVGELFGAAHRLAYRGVRELLALAVVLDVGAADAPVPAGGRLVGDAVPIEEHRQV